MPKEQRREPSCVQTRIQHVCTLEEEGASQQTSPWSLLNKTVRTPVNLKTESSLLILFKEGGAQAKKNKSRHFSSLRPNLSSFLPLICIISLFGPPRVTLRKE